MEIVFLILRLLLAAALYAFLGWTLWLLWCQLRQQAEKAGHPGIPVLTLNVENEEPSFSQFTRAEVIIGRQTGSDLRLDDKTISARHARLSHHHGQWWVEDLRSRNGTYVNDERLTSPVVLASGDALRCGGVRLSVAIQSTGEPQEKE